MQFLCNFISLITGWTVYTEKYKARGPDVQTDRTDRPISY